MSRLSTIPPRILDLCTRTWGRCGLASLAVVLLTPSAPFAGILVGNSFEVAQHKSAREMRTDVAMQANGDFVVVWERYPDWNSANVLMRRFRADGTPLGKVVPVTSAPGHQGEPAVAIAGSGSFLVAWIGDGTAGSGVYARLFDTDGSASTPPFLLHETPPGGQEPSATRDGDGFAIAWMSDKIHVVRLDAKGNVRGGYERPQSNLNGVQVRDLPGSKLALAWSSTHEIALSQDSYGPLARVDGIVLSSSNEIVEDFRTNEPRLRDSYDYIVDGERRISLASDAKGRFAIAHDSEIPYYLYNTDDHDGPFPLGAKLEMFAATASSFVGYYLADVPAAGLLADIAMTPGGNVLSSVETERVGLRAVDCLGIIPGNGLAYVSEEGTAVSRSSIAVNERGDGVVVWSEEYEGEFTLAARTFALDDGCVLCGDADANGAVTAGDALVTLRTAVGAASCAADRCDSDGSSTVQVEDALRILRASLALPGASLTCSDAPQIERMGAVEFPGSSYGWESPFTLVPDDEGAVLTWSDSSMEGGRTLSRRVSAALELDPEELVAGPDASMSHFDATGCVGEHGVAFTWATQPGYFTEGITLDLSSVRLSIPDGPVVQVHPDSIGEHRFGSITCLPDNRYAVAWRSRCGAVELEGNDPDDAQFFRPEECNASLPDGAHVRVLEADGSAVADSETIVLDSELHQETALARVDDGFVAAAGPVLQLRSNDGELRDEVSVLIESTEVSLSCLASRCARTDDGVVLMFDADDLDSIQKVEVQPAMQMGMERAIWPDQVSVACEAGGTCVLGWISHDLVSFPAYRMVAVPGVFARPFDLTTGKLGDTIRLPGDGSSPSGVSIAAVAPGVFLAAFDSYYKFTVHRIELR
jgi:hypothetical protein